jgi:Ca2+-binding RTX toxin-like protein
MQDSYFGMPQITLQALNMPVSTLNALIAAHDNAGAQAALFAGDDVITGGPLGDLFRGYAGVDTLNGGAGDDTLDGGAGGDTIITGGGADVIVVGQGQSLPAGAQSDTVADWNSADTVQFAHVAAGATYAEATAADYGAAASLARGLISTGNVNVVAVAVGSDVAVYADTGDDNGSADDVIILTGRTLADVSAGNFGLTGDAAPPPVVEPPPVVVSPAAPTGLKLDAGSDSGVKGDGITNVSQFHMTGVAEKGASISLYDGTTLVGVGQADATTGAFNVAPTAALADGVHTLSAVAANGGGASGYSASVNVILDSHASVSDFDGFTETTAGRKLNVALHGTASDATSGVSSVNVFQDGASIGVVMPVNGEWSVTKTNVTDAVHTYTLQTTDASGNVGAGSSTLILGSSGGDKIVGKATNDVIHGDAGADTQTGGAGADVFVYNALDDAALGRNKSAALDTITDFQAGTDKLDLSDLGHMTFKGQSATVSAHAVNWYVSGTDTFVTGDVTGDGKADFIIQLKGSLALSGSDFLLA